MTVSQDIVHTKFLPPQSENTKLGHYYIIVSLDHLIWSTALPMGSFRLLGFTAEPRRDNSIIAETLICMLQKNISQPLSFPNIQVFYSSMSFRYVFLKFLNSVVSFTQIFLLKQSSLV